MASSQPRLRNSFRHFRAHLEAMGLDKKESLLYARRLQNLYDERDRSIHHNKKKALFDYTAGFYDTVYDELREDFDVDMHSDEWKENYQSP